MKAYTSGANLGMSQAVNARDEDGKTELLRSVESGNYSKVKELIKNGADVTFVDRNGNTALMQACRDNHFDIARIIVEAMEPKLDKETSPEYYNNLLIKKYRFLNQKNRKGETALSIASARWKGFALDKYLISQSGSGDPKEFINSEKAKLENEVSIHKQLKESAQRSGSTGGREIEDQNIAALEAKLKAVDGIKSRLESIQDVIRKPERNKEDTVGKSLAKFTEEYKKNQEARAADKSNSLIDRISASIPSKTEFSRKLAEFEKEYLDDVGKFTERREKAKKEASTIQIAAVAKSPKLAKYTKAQKEKTLKTKLSSINSKEKAYKHDLEQQQKEIGKVIWADRLERLLGGGGGKVSGYTRDELRNMQKMLGRVIRSNQATGIVDKFLQAGKDNLKKQQKELGEDRFAGIFDDKVSRETRDQFREVQKELEKIIRSNQATGFINKGLPGGKKNVKARV
jgi:ankyrin repeat protein